MVLEPGIGILIALFPLLKAPLPTAARGRRKRNKGKGGDGEEETDKLELVPRWQSHTTITSIECTLLCHGTLAGKFYCRLR